MSAVAYFSAVIARNGSRWRALDVDLEELHTLDEVGDQLRSAGSAGPVIAVLEREDDWFALIRVDAEDDPRAFVSDLDAVERSRYADLLAPVGDVDLDEYADLRAPTVPPSTTGTQTHPDGSEDDGTTSDTDADPLLTGADSDLAAAAIEHEILPAWAGDPGVLADVGVEPRELVELVASSPGDPASVIADLGERCGFDELLEALR